MAASSISDGGYVQTLLTPATLAGVPGDTSRFSEKIEPTSAREQVRSGHLCLPAMELGESPATKQAEDRQRDWLRILSMIAEVLRPSTSGSVTTIPPQDSTSAAPEIAALA